jgi:flavin-dependent dehydrogenase
VSARVLIDATGRAARCASRVGARRLMLDRLVAIAVRFEGIEVERECNVLVEAVPDGWWYSAPVPGGRMVAMLMTDSDLCRRRRAASKDAWESLLSAASLTSARVNGARRVTAPAVHSAASQRLCRPDHRQRWIAVGDAALAVDPVSGSGVIRALQTAWSGAETAFALLDERAGDAIAGYETARDLECTRYLEERALYYGQEGRWPRASFWARRGVGREGLRRAA